jgi:hypothetical protein
MSICKTQLTEPCKKELLRIISYVTDRELNTLLKTEPSFSAGGFRSQKPAILRKRLEQIALGGPLISTRIRTILAAHCRTDSLLRYISTETLPGLSAVLAALLGAPVLITAALLDKRPEVREKAEDWLQKSPHFKELTQEFAAGELADRFADITDLTGAEVNNIKIVTKESWNEQKERLEQRIKTLQTENHRLKGVDDKNSRTNTLLKKEKEESTRLETKLKEGESTLRAIRKELEHVKAELQRETTRREDRLQAALDISLSQEFYGWLAEAKAIEIEAGNETPASDAIVFAEQALKKQKQVDRHSKNRLELSDRLDQLKKLHTQVTESLQSAIHQCPELKQAEKKLEEEINHLEELITPQRAASPIEEVLINKIHSASDESLPKLRTLPKMLKDLKLLSTKSLKSVELEFSKRLSAIEALGVPQSQEMQSRQDAASKLGCALAGKAPAILLLDGHNIVFGLPARYMPGRGKSVSDAQKRQHLIDDLVRITEPNPAMRSILLFDGHTRSDSDPSPTVRVSYSGGEGEHRADKVIIDQIRFLKGAYPDATVLLVSNDNDLCKDARRLGAQNLSVLDFGGFL